MSIRRRGFTLIELLITVAIIAILAAIATPNFLEAQTRSKVSRVHSDLRTLATALESYHADNTWYPIYALLKAGTNNVEDPAVTHGQGDFEHLSRIPGLAITTPVAYLATFPMDLFAVFYTGPHARDYAYKNSRYNVALWAGESPEPWMGPGGAQLYADWGQWRLSSAGPDKTRIADIKLNLIYDPTNGTVSRGDIVRSQRQSSSTPK